MRRLGDMFSVGKSKISRNVELPIWNILIKLKKLNLSKLCESMHDQILDSIKSSGSMSEQFIAYFDSSTMENGLYKDNKDDPTEIHAIKQLLNTVYQLEELFRGLEEIPFEGSAIVAFATQMLPLLLSTYRRLPRINDIKGLSQLLNKETLESLNHLRGQAENIFKTYCSLNPQILAESLGAHLESGMEFLPQRIVTDQDALETIAQAVFSSSKTIAQVNVDLASTFGCHIIKLSTLDAFKPGTNKKPFYILTPEALIYSTPPEFTCHTVLLREDSPETFNDLEDDLGLKPNIEAPISIRELRVIYHHTDHYPTEQVLQIKRVGHFDPQAVKKTIHKEDVKIKACLDRVKSGFSALRQASGLWAIPKTVKGFGPLLDQLLDLIPKVCKLLLEGKEEAEALLAQVLEQIQEYFPDYISYIEQVEEQFSLKSGTLVDPFIKNMATLQQTVLENFKKTVQMLEKKANSALSTVQNRVVHSLFLTDTTEFSPRASSSGSEHEETSAPNYASDFVSKRHALQINRLNKAILTKIEVAEAFTAATEFFKILNTHDLKVTDRERLLSLYHQFKKQVEQFSPRLNKELVDFLNEFTPSGQASVLDLFGPRDNLDIAHENEDKISDFLSYLRHQKNQTIYNESSIVSTFIHTHAQSNTSVTRQGMKALSPIHPMNFEAPKTDTERNILLAEAKKVVTEFLQKAKDIHLNSPDDVKQMAAHYKRAQSYLQLMMSLSTEKDLCTILSADSSIVAYIKFCMEEPNGDLNIWSALLGEMQQAITNMTIINSEEEEQEEDNVLHPIELPTSTEVFFRKVDTVHTQLSKWIDRFNLQLRDRLSPEILASLQGTPPFDKEEYYKDCEQVVLYKQILNALFYLKNSLKIWDEAYKKAASGTLMDQTKFLLQFGNGFIFNFIQFPIHLKKLIKHPAIDLLLHDLTGILKPLEGLPGIGIVRSEDEATRSVSELSSEEHLNKWIELQERLDSYRINSKWVMLRLSGDPSISEIQAFLRTFCLRNACDHLIIETASRQIIVEKNKITHSISINEDANSAFFPDFFDKEPYEFFAESTKAAMTPYTSIKGAIQNINYSSWQATEYEAAQIRTFLKHNHKEELQAIKAAFDQLENNFKQKTDQWSHDIVIPGITQIRKLLNKLIIPQGAVQKIVLLVNNLEEAFVREHSAEQKKLLYIKLQSELIKLAEYNESIDHKPLGTYSSAMYKQTEELKRLLMGSSIYPEVNHEDPEVAPQGLVLFSAANPNYEATVIHYIALRRLLDQLTPESYALEFDEIKQLAEQHYQNIRRLWGADVLTKNFIAARTTPEGLRQALNTLCTDSHFRPIPEGITDKLEEVRITGNYERFPDLYQELRVWLPPSLYLEELDQTQEYSELIPVLMHALRSSDKAPSSELSLLEEYNKLFASKFHQAIDKVVQALTDDKHQLRNESLRIKFITDRISGIIADKNKIKHLLNLVMKLLVSFNQFLTPDEAYLHLKNFKEQFSLVLLEAASDSEFHLGLKPGTLSEPLSEEMNRFYEALVAPIVEKQPDVERMLPDANLLKQLEHEKIRKRDEALRIQAFEEAITLPKHLMKSGEKIDNFERLARLKKEFQDVIDARSTRLYVVDHRKECLLHASLLQTFFTIYAELQPHLHKIVDDSFDLSFYLMYLSKPEDFISAINDILSCKPELEKHLNALLNPSNVSQLSLCDERIAYYNRLVGTPKYQRELHEFCGDAFDQWIMTQLDEFQASTGIQLEPSLFKEARSQFVEKVLNDFTTNQDLTTLAQCIKNSLENNSLAQAIQQSESQGKYIIEEVCGQRFDKWLLDQLKLIPESLHVKLPPILFAEAREKFIENATNHFEKNNDLNGLVAFIEQYLTQHSFKKTLTDDQKELEELSQHVIHFKQSVDEEQLPDRRIILQLVLANLQEEIAYRLMRDMAQSDQCRDMFYLKVFRQSELLFHIQTNFLKLSLSFPNLILNRERIFDYIQYINQINGIPHPSFSAKEEHIGEEFSKFWENLAELKHPSVQIDHLLSDFIEDEDLLHDLNKLGPYKADFIRQLHAVGFLHDFSQQLGEDFLTSIDSYSEDKKHLCSLIRQKFPLYEQEIKNFLVTYKHFVDLVSKSEQLQDEGVFFIALSKRLNSQAMFGKNFENQVILLQRVFQVYDMILGLKTHIEKRSAGLPLDQRLAVLQSLQEGISGVLANPESSWQELNFNFARELNKAKASLISLNDYKSDSTLFGTIKAKIVTPRSQKLVDTLCKEIDDVIDLTADKTGVIKQYKAQLQADRPSQTELISAKKL